MGMKKSSEAEVPCGVSSSAIVTGQSESDASESELTESLSEAQLEDDSDGPPGLTESSSESQRSHRGRADSEGYESWSEYEGNLFNGRRVIPPPGNPPRFVYQYE